MPQIEVQSEQLSQTAVEIHRSQPLTPLSVIFCGQVLTFQYFGQIKPLSVRPQTIQNRDFTRSIRNFF
jgi:hypothetical protein